MRTSSKTFLIFKVDFEKTYDFDRLSFLYYMMNGMEFASKWIFWIKMCLETIFISILVNGSLIGEFAL